MTNTTQENSELKLLKEFKKKTIKIFGPPGTGKTFTLIERVLKGHLKKGARPQQIAFLSFTNKAVNTAKERALEAFPQYKEDDFSKFNKNSSELKVKKVIEKWIECIKCNKWRRMPHQFKNEE